MIITKIIGGLGNQLFQYAAGRSLAHLNNTPLKLDTSAFDEYHLRNFDLLHFNVKADFASNDEIKKLLPDSFFIKAYQHLLPLKKRTYYKERYFHFNDRVLTMNGNAYIKGYFQSEKYFSPIKEIIQKEFRIEKNIQENTYTTQKEIKDHNSVSVHIRRGDFLKDKASAEFHGVLPVEYYLSAINIIRSKVNNPVFYFFSDDIKWVKENLVLPDTVFVSGERSKNHLEDLYLMSQCNHNIIANSSFSWWGAWLNNNPEKIVIAPENWFNKGPKDTQDLIPVSWIKI